MTGLHYKTSDAAKCRKRRWRSLYLSFCEYMSKNPAMDWKDIGEKIGVDPQCVRRWFDGLANPSHASMDKIELLLKGEL